MDVLHRAGGEVVVQHEVDSFEIDSSGEQSRADQHPNLTGPETAHYVVPLKQEGHREGKYSGTERTHDTVY